MVRLVTRSAKAMFGQVGDQVRKVKDQVGQGQGQELDNIPHVYKVTMGLYDYSVTPGPLFFILKKSSSFLAQILSGSRLGLVRLVTRFAKALFGQVGDQIVRSRTRLVKARARSLTIIVVCQAKISVYVLFII